MWNTTHEVGTALRKKMDVAGLLRQTSAFLLSSVELSLTATIFR